MIEEIDSRALEGIEGIDRKSQQAPVLSRTSSAEQPEDFNHTQLWEMGIRELAGHNIEA